MFYVIFDLDGTLALIDHRRHFVADGAHDWGAFFEACDADLPNEPIISLLRFLWNNGAIIYIFSGRSASVKEKTVNWLNDHIGFNSDGEPLWGELRMRPIDDFTPDDELKKKWLRELPPDVRSNIKYVVDDRQKVVDMWRAEGLTCLQVADGNF